ncbi:hypothetical protein M9H77_12974 [Catharanthus roseus]|uniref:Uncharacterized protein n=1 Tax=Catharanthus roseus TaxID=4058 RepID=A0ACC0BIZ4_CATRO|nr:hypothetical protein M9H77_12974 [Catharanthus roseus]
METIHPVRVMLFWDSEIAKDAYGPYFTGVVRKSWTLPTNRMISHNKLVRNILKYRDMDPKRWIVRMTMRVPLLQNEDDVVSSQSESDDDNDPKEGELQTLVNPVTENIVPQWESSQWFSSARYDYTHSGAFLDMGSGSPMDDLVESGTIQLLN